MNVILFLAICFLIYLLFAAANAPDETYIAAVEKAEQVYHRAKNYKPETVTYNATTDAVTNEDT